MTVPKTTRKTVGKTATKVAAPARECTESREKRIVRDLAERIERRGRERFSVKSANIRKRLMEIMKSTWPHSSDETLTALAIQILNQTEPNDAAIFAEIRELNSDIVPSERPMMPCPYETDAEVGK